MEKIPLLCLCLSYWAGQGRYYIGWWLADGCWGMMYGQCSWGTISCVAGWTLQSPTCSIYLSFHYNCITLTAAWSDWTGPTPKHAAPTDTLTKANVSMHLFVCQSICVSVPTWEMAKYVDQKKNIPEILIYMGMELQLVLLGWLFRLFFLSPYYTKRTTLQLRS